MFANAIVSILIIGLSIFLINRGIGRRKRGFGAKVTKQGNQDLIWGGIVLIIAIPITFNWFLIFLDILWQNILFVSGEWLIFLSISANGKAYVLIGLILFLFVTSAILITLQFHPGFLSKIRPIKIQRSVKRVQDSGKTLPKAKKLNTLKFVQMLDEHFDFKEFRELCYGINGVDIENLLGETKIEKMQSLVAFMDRRARLEELIQICQIKRSHINWKKEIDD